MTTVRATSFLTASAADWDLAVEIGNRHYLAVAGESVLKLLKGQKDDPKHGSAHTGGLHQQEGRGQRRTEQGGDGGEAAGYPTLEEWYTPFAGKIVCRCGRPMANFPADSHSSRRTLIWPRASRTTRISSRSKSV